MIRTLRVAYAIGFSDAVDPNVISAYMCIKKWKFDPEKEKSLKRRYYKAFQDCLDIKRNNGLRLVGPVILVGENGLVASGVAPV